MRQKKRAATRREDLEISGAGVLLGHDLIDIEQFNVLTQISLWLQRLARGWGGGGGVEGLWRGILAAASPPSFVRPESAIASGLADGARRALERALRQLDGTRALVVSLAENRVPPLVLHVLEGKLTRSDQAELTRLRLGLDHLAGRRQRAARV